MQEPFSGMAIENNAHLHAIFVFAVTQVLVGTLAIIYTTRFYHKGLCYLF